MADDPYSRLYWRLSDEFPEVYDDDARLALWTRLLVAADQAWPSAAFLPAFAEDGALHALVDCGLVEVDGKRYHIRGLDKERKRRRKSARKGAAAKWARHNADANADADADALAGAVAGVNAHAIGMPSRAEPSQDEPRRDETRQAARAKTSRKKGELTHIETVLGQ